jgi:hypothetical protein
MTQATTKDYWISPTALYIELNSLGNPNYIQASCISGAQILVYVKNIIDFDAGHNYRRWPLQAAPTVFNSNTEKYVYAAIPRDMTLTASAWIVFPSEQIDIYGKNEKEEQVGDEKYYYIFLQGIITSSGDNGTVQRDWKKGGRIVHGYLSTDEAISAMPNESDWYNYSSFDVIVTFLKNITMEAGTTFRQLFADTLTIMQGGKLSFDEQKRDIIGVADDVTPVTSNDTIVTPDYLDRNALSRTHRDTAQEEITFEKGLTAGSYERLTSGAAINADGAAEVESIVVREDLTVGDDVFVRADGGARLGDVEVARVRSKGADVGDRNLISGRGFDLFVGADGKSHLWVDDANIRGKLVAMSTEIRKVSYSGGTLLFSNAGSTLARVTAVTDDQGAVVAYKCWAKADDGTTQTMNWWRIGMMALCQTFNVSGNTGGNRRYWRLVVGVGQERLDDGKIYDYVLLSNIARFSAVAYKIPYYTSGSVLTAKGDVLRWAGEPVGVVQRKSDIPFVTAYVLQEGGSAGDVSKIKDDDDVLVMNRSFYGYEPTPDGSAPDAPMSGDVIVQCGDQVRWLSRGNVIRLCTSSDDDDIETTPSLSMYHGIGRLREVIVNGEAKADKSVWQWRDLTALISPTKTYINSDYFYFFSEESGGIEKAQSFSEFKMQSDKVAVSVRDVATGIEKAGVHLNGDDSCIVAKANKFYTENAAGVRTTSVDEEGNLIARSLHSVSKSESKVMYVDIEDGMLTFRTSQNNAMMQFGIDEHGFPSMVCYNPDGSIGCIYGPSGPNNNPLINPNAVLVMGEITGSYTYSKASFAGDKTMHTLSYTVKLTVKNNSGNYKTISNAVLKVKVASPYDAKTVELHSSDEKLLLNQETMDMTYTFVQSFSLPSSTMISIADNATVTVENEGGRTWTTRINKTN